MTLKSYLWGMRGAAFASLVAWILVIRQIDPESSGMIGEVLFMAVTFVMLACALILLFTSLRSRIDEPENALMYLGVSFRQGALIALLAVLLLVLQRYRVLTWWDSALTVAGILLVELYFLTRR